MKLDELRKLAEAATPGPWIITGPRGKTLFVDMTYGFVDANNRESHVIWGKNNLASANYIAALSPAVVLAMIECIEAGKAMRGDPSCYIPPALGDVDAFDAALARLESNEVANEQEQGR